MVSHSCLLHTDQTKPNRTERRDRNRNQTESVSSIIKGLPECLPVCKSECAEAAWGVSGGNKRLIKSHDQGAPQRTTEVRWGKARGGGRRWGEECKRRSSRSHPPPKSPWLPVSSFQACILSAALYKAAVFKGAHSLWAKIRQLKTKQTQQTTTRIGGGIWTWRNEQASVFWKRVISKWQCKCIYIFYATLYVWYLMSFVSKVFSGQPLNICEKEWIVSNWN